MVLPAPARGFTLAGYAFGSSDVPNVIVDRYDGANHYPTEILQRFKHLWLKVFIHC